MLASQYENDSDDLFISAEWKYKDAKLWNLPIIQNAVNFIERAGKCCFLSHQSFLGFFIFLFEVAIFPKFSFETMDIVGWGEFRRMIKSSLWDKHKHSCFHSIKFSTILSNAKENFSEVYMSSRNRNKQECAGYTTYNVPRRRIDKNLHKL